MHDFKVGDRVVVVADLRHLCLPESNYMIGQFIGMTGRVFEKEEDSNNYGVYLHPVGEEYFLPAELMPLLEKEKEKPLFEGEYWLSSAFPSAHGDLVGYLLNRNSPDWDEGVKVRVVEIREEEKEPRLCWNCDAPTDGDTCSCCGLINV
jgi:hypothetical protein